MKRELWRNALHLSVLSAFAFAEPLFDLLGKTPEFFVVRGSTAGDVVFFALVVGVLPAARARRGRGARRPVLGARDARGCTASLLPPSLPTLRCRSSART